MDLYICLDNLTTNAILYSFILIGDAPINCFEIHLEKVTYLKTYSLLR